MSCSIVDLFGSPHGARKPAARFPSVPMRMRHEPPGNLDLRARKDDLAHADAERVNDFDTVRVGI